MKRIRLFICTIVLISVSFWAPAHSAVAHPISDPANLRSAASDGSNAPSCPVLGDIPLPFSNPPSEIRKAFVFPDRRCLVQYASDTNTQCLFVAELFSAAGESLWHRVFSACEKEEAWSAYATVYPDGSEIVCEFYENLEFLYRVETRYDWNGKQLSQQKIRFSADDRRSVVSLPSFLIEHRYAQSIADVACLTSGRSAAVAASDGCSAFFELDDHVLLVVDEPDSGESRFQLLDAKGNLRPPVTLPLSWWNFLCAAGTSEATRLFYACADVPGQIAVYSLDASMSAAPQLLYTFALGEGLRIQRAFPVENGYVLLLRGDNNSRLVLLDNDAILSPLSALLPVACSSVQDAEPGMLSLILDDAASQGYRLITFEIN